MVILQKETKAPREEGRAWGRLSAVGLAVTDCGSSVRWLNEHLDLSLISLGSGQAVIATDLEPGSFKLELLEVAGPEGTAGPAAAAAAAAAQPGGGALAHFTLAVPSTEAVLQGLRASGQGGLIVEECAAVIPVRHHGHSWTDRTSIVRDPSGYVWQLMEVHSGKVRERLLSCTVMVRDLRASLAWHTGVLGMGVHQQYEGQGYLSALVGFGPELQCTLIELRQEDAAAAAAGSGMAPRQQQPRQERVPGLERFVISTLDLEAAAAHLQARGQPFERVQLASSEDASGAVPALALAGPDGWRYCLVEGEASEEERAAATLGAAGAAQAAVGGVAAQGAAAMEE